MYWGYDHALWLYPLPDALVLADPSPAAAFAFPPLPHDERPAACACLNPVLDPLTTITLPLLCEPLCMPLMLTSWECAACTGSAGQWGCVRRKTSACMLVSRAGSSCGPNAREGARQGTLHAACAGVLWQRHLCRLRAGNQGGGAL